MIYFDNGSTSHPKAPGVTQAIAEILERGCFNINRGGYSGACAVADMVYETREKLASFFGCPDSRQVVFTSSATESLNVALKGLLLPGDHVVTTQVEHNAVMRPLAQLRGQGIHVETTRCGPDGRLDIEDIATKITERTKLVVMTHASNVCGTILPVRSVGEICRERGAMLLIDSAQTAGVLPISMQDDNIDILAFAGHKGLLAVQGIGGLVLSQQIADKMIPLIAGGTGSNSHSDEMPAWLPDKLEAGTLNIPGIAALSAALDYINSIGVDTIYAQEIALLARLMEGIKAIEGIREVGPENPEDRCAVAALDFSARDNAAVAATLDEKYGIMTRCGLHCAPSAHKALGTFPQGVVRCSFGPGNTPEEVDKMLEALKQEEDTKLWLT